MYVRWYSEAPLTGQRQNIRALVLGGAFDRTVRVDLALDLVETAHRAAHHPAAQTPHDRNVNVNVNVNVSLK